MRLPPTKQQQTEARLTLPKSRQPKPPCSWSNRSPTATATTSPAAAAAVSSQLSFFEMNKNAVCRRSFYSYDSVCVFPRTIRILVLVIVLIRRCEYI